MISPKFSKSDLRQNIINPYEEILKIKDEPEVKVNKKVNTTQDIDEGNVNLNK